MTKTFLPFDQPENLERGLTKPLLTPTSAPRFATENQHFWEASKASPEKCPPFLERSERSFPLYIPLTGAPRFATENQHFWEVSKASPEKWLPFSWLKWEKFPSLHTPYWCTQNCWYSLSASERGLTNGFGHSSIYCIQQSIWNISLTFVYSHNFLNAALYLDLLLVAGSHPFKDNISLLQSLFILYFLILVPVQSSWKVFVTRSVPFARLENSIHCKT